MNHRRKKSPAPEVVWCRARAKELAPRLLRLPAPRRRVFKAGTKLTNQTPE